MALCIVTNAVLRSIPLRLFILEVGQRRNSPISGTIPVHFRRHETPPFALFCLAITEMFSGNRKSPPSDLIPLSAKRLWVPAKAADETISALPCSARQWRRLGCRCQKAAARYCKSRADCHVLSRYLRAELEMSPEGEINGTARARVGLQRHRNGTFQFRPTGLGTNGQRFPSKHNNWLNVFRYYLEAVIISFVLLFKLIQTSQTTFNNF